MDTKGDYFRELSKNINCNAPVIPHFSNECLTALNFNDLNWPKYDDSILKEDHFKIVVQINGKKEDYQS